MSAPCEQSAPSSARDNSLTLVAAVAFAAKRDWPQRWEGLLSALFQVASTGVSGGCIIARSLFATFVSLLFAVLQEHGQEMALMVFRDLAEEVTEFNPKLPGECLCNRIILLSWMSASVVAPAL